MIKVTKELTISEAQKLMNDLLQAIIDVQQMKLPAHVEYDCYLEGTTYIQPSFKIKPKK